MIFVKYTISYKRVSTVVYLSRLCLAHLSRGHYNLRRHRTRTRMHHPRTRTRIRRRRYHHRRRRRPHHRRIHRRCHRC